MAERKSKVAEAADPAAPPPASSPLEDPGLDPKPSKGEASAKQVTPLASPTAAPQPPVPEKDPIPLVMPTNAVAPHAPHDDTATRLLDSEGNSMDISTCLSYPAEDDPSELVTVVRRMYREFTLPNSVTTMVQLIHPVGARITKMDAKRLKDEMARSKSE